MITFTKKTDLPAPVPAEAEENRFERIRKVAAGERKKTGVTSNSKPEPSEDDRLI